MTTTKTIRVGINKDERWPDFSLADEDNLPSRIADVDAATVRRWYRAIRAYNIVQDEMNKAFEGGFEP